MSFSFRRVYADAASAVPVTLRAFFVFFYVSMFLWGNPSSFHREGVRARRALLKVRARVAEILEVRKEDVIFTSGATEANTLAVIGTYRALRDSGHLPQNPTVIIGGGEHSSVRGAVEELASLGVEVITIPLTSFGHIDQHLLAEAVTEHTFFVSFSLVQSEIGTIEPLRTLSRIVRKKAPEAVIHTDASQAPLWIPLSRARLEADLITLDGQKIGAPRGIGTLIVGRFKIRNILYGGGQESGRRPGTEPVALAASFAQALQDAQKNVSLRAKRIIAIRDGIYKKLHQTYPDIVVNGSMKERVAHNLNIWIPGRDAEYLVALLDRFGVSVSSRSACESVDEKGYSALGALPEGAERAYESLRITLLPTITRREARYITQAVIRAIQQFDTVNK